MSERAKRKVIVWDHYNTITNILPLLDKQLSFGDLQFFFAYTDDQVRDTLKTVGQALIICGERLYWQEIADEVGGENIMMRTANTTLTEAASKQGIRIIAPELTPQELLFFIAQSVSK